MSAGDFLVWLEATLEALGYELVDFERSSRGLIRLFIDSPQGITLQDCAKVSRHLSRAFLVKNVDYQNLEVSSPGLDRVLRKPSDFLRFVDSTVKVTFSKSMEVDAQKLPKTLVGRLLSFDSVGNFMRIEANGCVLSIPVAQTQRVRLVPNL